MLSYKIKQRIDIPIIFGGPFINLCSKLYPEAFDFIDYMIVGDGGIPLLKLIDYLKHEISINEVPNLVYREGGVIINNPETHYPIDDMPIPDFDGLSLQLYRNKYFFDILLPYQITRGCTSRCSFCNHKSASQKLEFKSYDKVISELRQMKEKYNNKMFRFCDDVINNSYKYLEGLCDLMIKNRLGINWCAWAKFGNLDKHILTKMNDAGCFLLFFGIESGSDSQLKKTNKDFTSDQASKTLKDSSEAGIANIIFLITGLPHETKDDIRQTKELLEKNRRYIYANSIYKFSLTYRSPIYYNPESFGVTNLRPSSLLNRFWFAFDELGGLQWEDKLKQQEKSKREIVKTVKKMEFYKIYRLIFFSLICCSSLLC